MNIEIECRVRYFDNDYKTIVTHHRRTKENIVLNNKQNNFISVSPINCIDSIEKEPSKEMNHSLMLAIAEWTRSGSDNLFN